MEQHRSVRHARRTFSEILNTAAYGDDRIVVVRHKTEVAVELDLWDLERRERLHTSRAALPGGDESWRRELAAERELLDAERAWLGVLLALAKKDAPAGN